MPEREVRAGQVWRRKGGGVQWTVDRVLPVFGGVCAHARSDGGAYKWLMPWMFSEHGYDLIEDTPMTQNTETTHACPPGDSGVTPCCGLTPFELPRTDRMTLDPALVNCEGASDV